MLKNNNKIISHALQSAERSFWTYGAKPDR